MRGGNEGRNEGDQGLAKSSRESWFKWECRVVVKGKLCYDIHFFFTLKHFI